jgi:hypothetical protein
MRCCSLSVVMGVQEQDTNLRFRSLSTCSIIDFLYQVDQGEFLSPMHIWRLKSLDWQFTLTLPASTALLPLTIININVRKTQWFQKMP